MTAYRVTWEIDIEADSAFEAAMRAKWFQLHGDWSSTFDVTEQAPDDVKGTVQIDLDEQATAEDWERLFYGGPYDQEESE